MYATANAYNQTVSIELVGGTMMLVDQISKTQVATLSGALDEWARAAYPSPSTIADMKKSGELPGAKAELNGLLAAVAAGTPMTNALAARRADQEAGGPGLTKRVCACPVVIFSCQLNGCGGACIVIFCTG